MADSAYLSRPQIYRALLKDTAALNSFPEALDYLGAIPTNPEFVFPYLQTATGDGSPVAPSGLRADRELPDDPDLAQQEQEEVSGEGHPIEDWPFQRLGADNLNASTFADNADLNDKNTPVRRNWFDHVALMNIMLEKFSAEPEFVTFGNPHAYEEEDRTLMQAVQAELRRFRSQVYAPNSKSDAHRRRYFKIAYADTIARAQNFGPSTSRAAREADFFNSRNRTGDRHRPILFTFHKDDPPYNNNTQFVATRILVRIIAIHNALYGSDLKPFNSDLNYVRSSRRAVRYMLANISAGIAVLAEDIETWIDEESERQEELEEDVEETISEELEEFGFDLTTLTESEVYSISTNPAYEEYFSTTFSQDVITAIPIINNLYLTERYFMDIESALASPKAKALSTLVYLLSQDANFNMEPNMSNADSQAAIAAATGNKDHGIEARDFILKMLIQAPINILKGLAELIDPHLAITKLIKTGSSYAFGQGAKALNAGPVDAINESTAATMQQFGFEDYELNLTGKKAMGLLLCLMDAGFRAGDMGIKAAISDAGLPDEPGGNLPNFFPTVDLDGIDMTGTVAGMFMIPPTPFGFLYLLLELIKNEIGNRTENVDGAGDNPPDCSDQEGE